MYLENPRETFPGPRFGNALQADFVEPAVAVIEQVLKRPANVQLKPIDPGLCSIPLSFPPEWPRVFENEWRAVLLEGPHPHSWPVRSSWEVERVEVRVESVEGAENRLMKIIESLITPHGDPPPDPPISRQGDLELVLFRHRSLLCRAREPVARTPARADSPLGTNSVPTTCAGLTGREPLAIPARARAAARPARTSSRCHSRSGWSQPRCRFLGSPRAHSFHGIPGRSSAVSGPPVAGRARSPSRVLRRGARRLRQGPPSSSTPDGDCRRA